MPHDDIELGAKCSTGQVQVECSGDQQLTKQEVAVFSMFAALAKAGESDEKPMTKTEKAKDKAGNAAAVLCCPCILMWMLMPLQQVADAGTDIMAVAEFSGKHPMWFAISAGVLWLTWRLNTVFFKLSVADDDEAATTSKHATFKNILWMMVPGSLFWVLKEKEERVSGKKTGCASICSYPRYFFQELFLDVIQVWFWPFRLLLLTYQLMMAKCCPSCFSSRITGGANTMLAVLGIFEAIPMLLLQARGWQAGHLSFESFKISGGMSAVSIVKAIGMYWWNYNKLKEAYADNQEKAVIAREKAVKERMEGKSNGGGGGQSGQKTKGVSRAAKAAFQMYTGDVLDSDDCGASLDHGDQDDHNEALRRLHGGGATTPYGGPQTKL